MTENKLREIIRKQLDAIVENSTPIKPDVELEIPEPITKTDEEISKIIETLNIIIMTEDKLREIIRKQLDAIVENSTPIKAAVELEMPEPITETNEEISKIIETLNINEGQFSWYTSDTNAQIGSERQNTITVYMHDNEGGTWKEKNYEGYGVFGGYDYYSLLAKMNGYTEEDRGDGIDLAFNKKKSKTSRKTLFPALTESPKLPRNHDFTKESDSDPNQSWYQEEEDGDFEY